MYMQILWIKSDYIDPPDTGGKIRTYNLLRELNGRCPVIYLSLRNNQGSACAESRSEWASRIVSVPYFEEKKSGLRFALRVFAKMFSKVPYIVQKYRSREVKERQRQIVETQSERSSIDTDTVLVCD